MEQTPGTTDLVSAFEDDVAELRVAFLKTVGAIDTRYSGTDDDYIVVGNIILCGHIGGELVGSGQEFSIRAQCVAVTACDRGEKGDGKGEAFERNNA